VAASAELPPKRRKQAHKAEYAFKSQYTLHVFSVLLGSASRSAGWATGWAVARRLRTSRNQREIKSLALCLVHVRERVRWSYRHSRTGNDLMSDVVQAYRLFPTRLVRVLSHLVRRSVATHALSCWNSWGSFHLQAIPGFVGQTGNWRENLW